MKKIFLLAFSFAALKTFAQTDSINNNVIVFQDYRLEILARKQVELNEASTKSAARSAMGYRLQILSTNDREFAMKTRTQLLQKFPEQKVYMMYQMPYVKLKFGNFKTKQEADPYKKLISRMLDGASIYTIAERIEIKPEKEIKLDN